METGRYNSVPYENRKCQLCDLNEIGDEFHFLFICSKFTDERNLWLDKINVDIGLISTDRNQLLKEIFKFPRQTAKFICK